MPTARWPTLGFEPGALKLGVKHPNQIDYSALTNRLKILKMDERTLEMRVQ
jgi:hypothetical protein